MTVLDRSKLNLVMGHPRWHIRIDSRILRYQTTSEHHISNPSRGHFWPKLGQFGPPWTKNWGALFSIFPWTIAFQFWTIFGKTLATFGPSLVILNLQHGPPANCYMFFTVPVKLSLGSFLGQLHTKLVLKIWVGPPAILADFPVVFFIFVIWDLSWNTAGGGDPL